MASEHAALAALDAALAHRPAKDGHDFSHATMCLVDWRKRLTDRLHKGEPVGPTLERVNALISVVIGAHFPLGEIHWPSVEKARDSLAELVAAPPRD